MKFIIAKKVAMTQVWKGDNAIAVTQVQADPCTVVQLKNQERDGYLAVQLGFGQRREKNIKKPQRGHMKDLGNFAKLREFRVSELNDLKKGDKIDVSTFSVGDKVQVTATSKGKGFQGGIKRHGFHGHKMTHGNKDQQRMPGSVGAKGPARIFKGMKMPGQMGNDRVTIKNLEIIEVDIENNTLLIKGAIPGAREGLILISGKGDLIIGKETPVVEEVAVEETAEVENSTEEKVEEVKEEIKEEAVEVKAEEAEVAVEAAAASESEAKEAEVSEETEKKE